MNLLLLEPQDFVANNRVILSGRRFEQIERLNKLTLGDQLKVGLIDHQIGTAEVSAISTDSVELLVSLHSSPPPPLPLTLIIALPRPKMIKRILQTIATMGVKNLIFINSYRVEKSYWQSPLLNPESIREHLLLGLEQGVDTILPKVTLEKRFKPFVEDRMADICRHKRALVAHPHNAKECPNPSTEESVLIIGPEGGFIDYEIDKLSAAGCESIHLGSRILRVETAVPVLLAKLFPV